MLNHVCNNKYCQSENMKLFYQQLILPLKPNHPCHTPHYSPSTDPSLTLSSIPTLPHASVPLPSIPFSSLTYPYCHPMHNCTHKNKSLTTYHPLISLPSPHLRLSLPTSYSPPPHHPVTLTSLSDAYMFYASNTWNVSSTTKYSSLAPQECCSMRNVDCH